MDTTSRRGGRAEAVVTLRAHRPGPARVELAHRGVWRRAAGVALWLAICWGAAPLVLRVPPHYPWAAAAIILGALLAYREWTGRYRVVAFAGICPRCGHSLRLGARCIDLPHRLSCFHCHFEPVLEVVGSSRGESATSRRPEHREGGCTGRWSETWLADEPYLVCWRCLAHAPATTGAREAARMENERADLLERLADEGRWMA